MYMYIYITHVYNIYGDLPTGMHIQKEVWMEWWILEEMVAGGPTDELPTDLLSGHIFGLIHASVLGISMESYFFVCHQLAFTYPRFLIFL